MVNSNNRNSRDDKSKSGRESTGRRRTDKPEEKSNNSYSKTGDRPKSSYGGSEKPNKERSSSRPGKSDDRPKSNYGRSERPNQDRPDSRAGRSDDRSKSNYGTSERPNQDRPDSRAGRTDDRPKSNYGRSERPNQDRPDSRAGRSDDRSKSNYGRSERPNQDRPDSRAGRSDDRPKSNYGRGESNSKDFKPRRDKDAGGKDGYKPWEKKEGRPRAFKAASSSDGVTESKRGYIKREDQSPEDYKAFQETKRTERSFDSRPFRKREDGDLKPRREERGDSGTAPKNSAKTKDDDLIRLNRYIANSGICSRRKADELIAAGVVSVNNVPVTELGHKVNPYKDEVRYNGELLKREKKIYVLLNKPKDYITTTDDPQERKTVMELVDKASKERIYPVGRLDRNTTGLLLMTNDGDLADKLSHPKNSITKIYHIELSKSLSQGDFNKIEFGLELEDGTIKPDKLSYVAGASKREIGIQIHSGKNRIVRRIFEHLGYEVVKLDRVVYGNLTKKDLPRGRWRYLDEQELIQIKHLMK